MSRPWLASCAALVVASSAGVARAGDFDLDDDASQDAGSTAAQPAPIVAHRTYSLAEVLDLVDRNHPFLWAARARVAAAHGQLDEARWYPFWQWNAQASGGIVPFVGGSVLYNTQASPTALNPNNSSDYQPFFQFSVSGVIPLYTFGKITAAVDAAKANIRYQEWDMAKVRDTVRMDTRRAYFGLMAARDAKYLAKDILDKVQKALDGVEKRLAKGQADEIDKMRLLIYRDQLLARSGEPDKNEAYALAALRFFTGVPNGFDVPDKPLERPSTPLGPLVQYLAAARLYRPDVNEARAGVMARKAQLDLQRARFFPDIGVALGASYSSFPSVVQQNSFWVANSALNSFGFGVGLGVRWSLDLLPNQARVEQVESQLEEARAMERAALGGIAIEVENAYAVTLEARKREEQWARLEHRTKEWIVSTQDAIDLGTKSEPALLEPLRNYFDARINHLWSLIDVNIAQSDLARVTGWDAAAPTGE